MLKEDILNLIEKFEKGTWNYSDNNNLDNDHHYLE